MSQCATPKGPGKRAEFRGLDDLPPADVLAPAGARVASKGGWIEADGFNDAPQTTGCRIVRRRAEVEGVLGQITLVRNQQRGSLEIYVKNSGEARYGVTCEYFPSKPISKSRVPKEHQPHLIICDVDKWVTEEHRMGSFHSGYPIRDGGYFRFTLRGMCSGIARVPSIGEHVVLDFERPEDFKWYDDSKGSRSVRGLRKPKVVRDSEPAKPSPLRRLRNKIFGSR